LSVDDNNVSRTEIINGAHHIYATPSPTTEPHPPQEGTLPPIASEHYEFSQAFHTNPNEALYQSNDSHYSEIEESHYSHVNDPNSTSRDRLVPGNGEAKDYAEPNAKPYEIPLTALQQVANQVRKYDTL